MQAAKRDASSKERRKQQNEIEQQSEIKFQSRFEQSEMNAPPTREKYMVMWALYGYVGSQIIPLIIIRVNVGGRQIKVGGRQT